MRALLSLRMAFEHVRAAFGRVLLSVVAIALGVALVVAIGLMNASVLASFLETADDVAGRAHLTVTASDGATFPEQITHEVEKVPGVELAVPLVRAIAFPDDGSGELLTVHGVDVTHDAAVRVYHRSDRPNAIVDDELSFVAQPDSVVLGREFAERHGLSLESRLPLVTPRGVRTFVVRGLLDAQGVARTLGGRLVVMDRMAAEAAFTAPGWINQVDVLVAPGRAITDVKHDVAAVLPAGLSVDEPSLRKDVIRRTVGGFQAMLTGLGLLAVLVGFIICYSRLGAIFEARAWEIGLLRSVGASRLAVFAEMMKESLLLGALGTLVGVPLGVWIGMRGLPLVARATALNFGTGEPATAPLLAPAPLVTGAVVGLTAAVAASIIPALRVTQADPIVALALRGREIPPSMPRFAGLACLGLLALCAGLIVLQSHVNAAWPGAIVTGLLALAAATSGTLLVGWGSRALGPLWKAVFGPTGEMAMLRLGLARRRAGMTVSTLGIGLGAVLMFGIVGWSFERSLVAQMTTRLRSDLVVTSMFQSGGWISAPLADEIVGEMERVPGVARVAAGQIRTIEYRGTSVALYAYDRPCLVDLSVCDWDLVPGAPADAMPAVGAGAGVLVSPAFAAAFRVSPGERIEIASPRGPRALVVSGVTRTTPETAIIMDRETYREAWGDHRVTWVYAKLAPGARTPVVEAELARRLGETYRVQVRSVAKLIEFLAKEVRSAFRALYVMEAITLLLVVISVGDLLTTSVIERTRELATLRAIGLRRRDLFATVLHEGMAVGLLGLVAATAAGLALGFFWVEIQFPALLGWSFAPYVDPGLLVAIAVGTVVLCGLGSLLPSLRAAWIPVDAALRSD